MLHVVQGKVILPDKTLPDYMVELILNTEQGQELKAFCDLGGSFLLQAVPPGNHLLNVYGVGYQFAEVNLEVNDRVGLVRAVYVYNKQALSGSSLTIRPVGVVSYLEKRAPVDVLALLKSPMGLITMFILFAVVVLPRLKIDPEELREYQEQMGGGPAPAQVEDTPGPAPARIQNTGRSRGQRSNR